MNNAQITNDDFFLILSNREINKVILRGEFSYELVLAEGRVGIRIWKFSMHQHAITTHTLKYTRVTKTTTPTSTNSIPVSLK